MVYRGRPSAACSACRTRRIKCDANKPGCSQCSRVRIVCPGYRDPLDQLFRDESAAVGKKAQRGYIALGKFRPGTTAILQSTNRPARSDVDSGATRQNDGLSTPLGAPGPPLTQAFGDVALAHFMSSYVPESHFVYLPNLYNLRDQDAALPATVNAASLAKLAWELGQPSLMVEAKRAYAKALIETNSALSNPRIATTDATLVSVLLLSLYETIICAEAGTPDNWIKHTRGALALIQLRGRRQLDTPVGRSLFTQVANIICVDNMKSGQRVPADLVELQKAALHYTEENPRFEMSSCTAELTNLLVDVKQGHMTPLEVVEATKRLEAKYVAFISSLPASWQFETKPLGTALMGVYGKTIHHYSSNSSARFWNSYRMARIFLNGIMHGHARYLQPPDKALLLRAEYNVNEMATDICASVPQSADPKNFSFASAATLLWPLSTVRSADLVAKDLREYAEGRLAFFGCRLRISQAEQVASSREVGALQAGLHMFYLS